VADLRDLSIKWGRFNLLDDHEGLVQTHSAEPPG
jgi:hypothetical protein